MELEHDGGGDDGGGGSGDYVQHADEAEQLEHDNIQQLTEQNLTLSRENTRLQKLAEENAELTRENSKLHADARRTALHSCLLAGVRQVRRRPRRGRGAAPAVGRMD